jgi:hypothetical protein
MIIKGYCRKEKSRNKVHNHTIKEDMQGNVAGNKVVSVENQVLFYDNFRNCKSIFLRYCSCGLAFLKTVSKHFSSLNFGLVWVLKKDDRLCPRMRSFGSILNLVGGSTVTLLTFVFPPLFYMRLADASLTENGGKAWIER